MGEDRRKLQNLRGMEKQVLGRQKWREFTAEIVADKHFPAEKLFACPHW